MAGVVATVGITEKPYLARNAKALQSVYTDRATPADWQSLVSVLRPVQKLVHLTGRWVDDDIENLETRLFNELRITYRDGLQQELNKWGCAGVSAVIPAAGAELSAIRDRVRFAANSVGNTYNLELAREIIRIGEDTPTANRHTYAFRLYNRQGSWDSAYWVAKAEQIAQIETMTVVNAAVADFYSRNGDLLQPQAIVVPFTAAESVCAQIVSENPYRTVDTLYSRWTLPVHIGCPHRAEVRSDKRLDSETCRMLWAGE